MFFITIHSAVKLSYIITLSSQIMHMSLIYFCESNVFYTYDFTVSGRTSFNLKNCIDFYSNCVCGYFKIAVVHKNSTLSKAFTPVA